MHSVWWTKADGAAVTKRVKEYQAIEDQISALEVRLDELWDEMTKKEKAEVSR